MNDSFKLQEMANWQQYNDKLKAELPFIQEGFVRNPKQVEDLWDSLLRSYPIGSFLFSKSETSVWPTISSIGSPTSFIRDGGLLNRISYYIHTQNTHK